MHDTTNDERLKILQERLAQIKQKRENSTSKISQRKEATEISTSKVEKSKEQKDPNCKKVFKSSHPLINFACMQA